MAWGSLPRSSSSSGAAPSNKAFEAVGKSRSWKEKLREFWFKPIVDYEGIKIWFRNIGKTNRKNGVLFEKEDSFGDDEEEISGDVQWEGALERDIEEAESKEEQQAQEYFQVSRPAAATASSRSSSTSRQEFADLYEDQTSAADDNMDEGSDSGSEKNDASDGGDGEGDYEYDETPVRVYEVDEDDLLGEDDGGDDYEGSDLDDNIYSDNYRDGRREEVHHS